MTKNSSIQKEQRKSIIKGIKSPKKAKKKPASRQKPAFFHSKKQNRKTNAEQNGKQKSEKKRARLINGNRAGIRNENRANEKKRRLPMAIYRANPFVKK